MVFDTYQKVDLEDITDCVTIRHRPHWVSDHNLGIRVRVLLNERSRREGEIHAIAMA